MSPRGPNRFLAQVVGAVILLAACGGTAGTVPGISPPGSASGAAAPGQSSASAGGAPTGAPTAGHPPGGGRPGGGPAGGGSTAGGQTAASNPDAGVLGSMSRGFLRPAPYSNLDLEIDAAGAAGPSSSVVSDMVGLLNRETGKPVSQAGSHALAGHGTGCWTDSDIGAAAAQRSTHTSGANASMLTLFLDGRYCSDANVLGLAFGATSMVVFSAQVEKLATVTVGPDQFMKSVVNHEIGHILGLVNIGYQSRINHEDPAHPHHSSSSQSVMYWAIDQGNVIQQFVQGPPESFDSDDEADLAGLRDGTY